MASLDSGPSQSAMTLLTTPACRRFIAAVWRRTCGETVLVASVGQLRLAVVACLLTSRATASRLSARPRLVGNSGWSGSPERSLVQRRRTSVVCAVSGVMRCLRPLPEAWMCGALASCVLAAQGGQLGEA